MERYVEIDEARKYLKERSRPGEYNGFVCGQLVPVDMLTEVPTADVISRRKIDVAIDEATKALNEIRKGNRITYTDYNYLFDAICDIGVVFE